MPPNEETRRLVAEVIEVHSGDDLMLMVDLGFDGLYKKVRARLHGVDTPDAYQATNESDAGKLRDQVKALTRNRPCFIDLHATRKGGWIVTLYVGGRAEETPLCLNQKLIEQGYVYKG